MRAQWMSAGEYFLVAEILEGLPIARARDQAAELKPGSRKSRRTHRRANGARDVRLRYLAARIHRLGPRPLYQLLLELEASADLRSRLERYAELDPSVIRELGGDAFSIGVIDGGRSC